MADQDSKEKLWNTDSLSGINYASFLEFLRFS